MHAEKQEVVKRLNYIEGHLGGIRKMIEEDKYCVDILRQTMVLSVPDVSCEHCVKTVNGALGALPGVEAVSTDIPTKSVHLRFDPNQLSLELIETTLDDAGYTVAKEPQPTHLRQTSEPTVKTISVSFLVASYQYQSVWVRCTARFY